MVRSPLLDPLIDSPWSKPETVTGFSQSPPNDTLMGFVGSERRSRARLRILDIGCGAGRNAVPLAAQGHEVFGVDLSLPMLNGAQTRARHSEVRLQLALAPMDAIPCSDRSFDVVIAHGIWNLARSGTEFRRAVREASRVSRPGASLFVFTFSRSTLPIEASPIPGETFIFTRFSGRPQCFLTREELVSELGVGGFQQDPAVPLTEHNRPRAGQIQAGGPVIYEGAFRFATIPSS